ncbi:MAG: tetratricopeptide repeat protein [Proteobacteria bacterium]|jgi:hypothetical protein|nr:tetratricopeptide repeat protein [Pseudomonadota bacterium]
MMRKLGRFCVAGIALSFLLPAGVQVAAAAGQPAAITEEKCIPTAIEEKVTTCPGGFKMGTFSGKPKAKVGTSTKEKEVKKETGPSGPGLAANFVQNITESAFKRKREAKKVDILKKEIELIKRLAKQTPNDNPEKGEILKRLADAYKEMYDQYNFMARGLEEKIFQTKDKAAKAKFKAQQKGLDDMATGFREEAIKAYVEIRNNFPDYPDYDEILFAIAYEIDQMANELDDKQKDKKGAFRERARIFYQELIRNYPRSKFIPHSWMAFGEFYFQEAHDVERAMKAYEKVVEWGEENNPNYVVAMYYQAWCLFNLQEYKTTINQFNKVIQYAGENLENKEAQVVAKRARIEMVDPFSKIGNPEQAWQFFQKVGGGQAHQMLEKLANLYYDDGHWADAVIVFHQLEKLEIENFRKNGGDDLCYFQTMVTNAVISSSPKDKQVEEVTRQIALSKKFESEKHDAAKIKKCQQDTISFAWDLATQWHLEAVGSESAPGTKDHGTMKLCISMYDELLKQYPNLDTLQVEGFDESTKPTKYRVAYYKAELYWHMEDWANCAPAFDAVVDMDPTGVYTSDSAYAAVLCYNKIYVAKRSGDDRSRTHKLKSDTGNKVCDKACKKCKTDCNKKKTADEKKACMKVCDEGERIVLAPRELTDLEKGTLKSYDRYVCYVNEGEDLISIKYRRARIYYEANMFAESATLFYDIAVNHSDAEVGIYAANLYLDSLNALGSMVEKPIPSCYDDLASAVDVFIDTSKKPGSNLMKDEEFAGQIKSLKVGVLRKKAESLTTRGRFKEAAEIYLTIYREFTGVYDDRGMCEVLFNTAINLESARLVMSAIKVREKMIKEYPNCEHSKRAAYFIGENYHALQSFSQAADNYVAFAKKYPGEPEAPTALGNAVMFYIGLGKTDDAFKTVSLYEKNYGGRHVEDTATVVFSAGYIHINEKDWEAVRKWYTSYLKKYAKAKLLDEQIQANVFIADTHWNAKKQNTTEAIKFYKKAEQLFDKGGMDKVTDPTRKANMLIAAAKAKYYIAEVKYREFEKVEFPEFVGQRKVPDKIYNWWKKEQGPAKVTEIEKWNKDRRRLARWGYWDEGKPVKEQIKDVKKEEKKEALDMQFAYWAKTDLGPWMEKKSKLMTEATDLFTAVAAVHVPEWEMAAAARAGDMQFQFMTAIYDSPLPPSFKGDQELTDIYRTTMDERAEPYRTGSIKAFEYCLNISTKVRWFNENSLRCERELNKLEPRQYPISEETRVEPKFTFNYWAAPDPVLELETDAQKRDKALTASAEAIGDEGGDAAKAE